MNTEPTAEDVLNRPVAALGLPKFVLTMLAKDGIVSVGDLIKRSETDLLHIPGCGRRSVNKVMEALGERGIVLSTTPFRSGPYALALGVADVGMVTVQLSIAEAEQLYRVLRQALKEAGRIREL